MKSQIPQRNLIIVFTIATVTMCIATAAAAVEVTLDPAVQYQTILGWGAASWSPPWVSQSLREALIRDAVNGLGGWSCPAATEAAAGPGNGSTTIGIP